MLNLNIYTTLKRIVLRKGFQECTFQGPTAIVLEILDLLLIILEECLMG